MVTLDLAWIARKYELEELTYHQNLSQQTSKQHNDMSQRILYSGVRYLMPLIIILDIKCEEALMIQ